METPFPRLSMVTDIATGTEIIPKMVERRNTKLSSKDRSDSLLKSSWPLESKMRVSIACLGTFRLPSWHGSTLTSVLAVIVKPEAVIGMEQFRSKQFLQASGPFIKYTQSLPARLVSMC